MTLDIETAERGRVIVCPDCEVAIATDDPTATLEHGDGGAHIYRLRYGA